MFFSLSKAEQLDILFLKAFCYFFPKVNYFVDNIMYYIFYCSARMLYFGKENSPCRKSLRVFGKLILPGRHKLGRKERDKMQII
jgi:hypothetical protein